MSERIIEGWNDLKNYDLREAILEINRQFELIEAEYQGGLSVLRKEAEKLGVSTKHWDRTSASDKIILVSMSMITWINALKEGLRTLEIRVENLEHLNEHK